MKNRKLILMSGVALAVFMLSPTIHMDGSSLSKTMGVQISTSAFAEEDGGGSGQQGGHKGHQYGKSGDSHGSGGHSGGSGDEGSHGSSGGGDEGSDEGHQGGPSAESDAKGPHYKGGDNEHKPGDGDRGGKPVWAQEGIPEVELGRLNVARSPSHVLDQAGAEAVSNFSTEASAELYSMSAEDFASYVETNYSSVTRIDSPLENLSLFKDVLSDGVTQLPGVTPASTLDLAAIFLGSASDKTIAISEDTVKAVVAILDLPDLTPAQVKTLADKAEDVREAILAGHGE